MASSAEAEVKTVEEVKVDASTETPSPDVKPADTPSESAAGQDKGPTSTLDAVKAALGKPKDAEATPTPEGKPDAAEAGPSSENPDDDLPEEVTDDELSHYHSRTRKRIKGLVEKVKTLGGTVESLTPKAERFDQITRFVADAGLDTDEVNTLFEVGRLMKSDPAAAYKAIMPYVVQLQQVLGVVLPQDLQQEVSQGLIATERAQELARARAEAGLSRQRAELVESRTQQEQAGRVTADIERSVAEWEQKWSSTDPDYRAKQPRVMKEIELELLRRRGSGRLPRTTTEAVALAEQARKTVEEDLKAFIPRKPEIKPVTGGSAVRSTPAPSNSLEAVKFAMQRAG